MTRVGIINVTGYAGAELARLLSRHPMVSLVSVTGRSTIGQSLGEVYPHLAATELTITEDLDSVDLAFSALDHKASAEKVIPLIEQGLPVIDLSADFRLKNAEDYSAWYSVEHPSPEKLADAVYGLTELHKNELPKSKLVANPGCFPTGAVLALAPAVKEGLIASDIIIDSKSGVSGAGRKLTLTSHFSEVNESVSAYGLDGHRHYPEIVQELNRLNPQLDMSITFLPHLIPMTRGILSSCYAHLSDHSTPANSRNAIVDLYKDFYKDDPFVIVAESPPATKQTLGNNNCLVYPTVDPRTNRLVVISALDNLVKGAAGEAVQNMNIMLGLPETIGLEHPALYP